MHDGLFLGLLEEGGVRGGGGGGGGLPNGNDGAVLHLA